MQVILIVLDSDIPSAALCASSLRDSEYYTYVFDTKLVNTVVSTNFRNVRIAISAGMHEYKFLDIAAQKLAKHDELRIDEGLKPVNVSLSIRNWQNLNFYYLRIAYLWYSELWDEFISQESEDNKHQVFVCNSAVQYCGPSFQPATLLIGKLKSYSRDYGTTVYQKPCLDPVVLVGTGSVDVQQSAYELITHLPACYYDHEYLNQEIRACGLKTLDIKANQGNPNLSAHKHLLVGRLIPEQQSLKVLSVFLRIQEIIAEILSEVVGYIEYRTIQSSR